MDARVFGNQVTQSMRGKELIAKHALSLRRNSQVSLGWVLKFNTPRHSTGKQQLFLQALNLLLERSNVLE